MDKIQNIVLPPVIIVNSANTILDHQDGTYHVRELRGQDKKEYVVSTINDLSQCSEDEGGQALKAALTRLLNNLPPFEVTN